MSQHGTNFGFTNVSKNVGRKCRGKCLLGENVTGEKI